MSKYIIPPDLRFKCSQCGKCCTHLQVPLSANDHKKIANINWKNSEIADQKWAKNIRQGRKELYELNHSPCGGCVFLTPDKLCMIHAQKGESTKPLACQIFPFKFTKIEDKIYVGAKFNCPAILSGKGPKVKEKELGKLFRLQIKQVESKEGQKLAPFFIGFLIPWKDFEQIEQLIVSIIESPDLPLGKKLILGSRLLQALKTQAAGTEEQKATVELDPNVLFQEIAAEEITPAKVSLGERLLFSQFFAYLATAFSQNQKNLFSRMGVSFRKWLVLLGGGKISLEDIDASVKIRKVKKMPPEMLDEGLELLEHYYRTKLYARDYFGEAFFHLSAVSGFNLFLVIYPLFSWLARASAIGHKREVPELEDYHNALYLIDHCFYSSEILSGSKGKIMNFMLSAPGVAENIIRYYTFK